MYASWDKGDSIFKYLPASGVLGEFGVELNLGFKLVLKPLVGSLGVLLNSGL